jgi:hypothetical protein
MDGFNVPSGSSPSLLQIKSWDLFIPGEAMNFLDLKGAKDLSFSCKNGGLGFKMEFLPSQLTTMILDDFEIDSESLLTGGPHLMPCLIELTLLDLEIEGRIQDYLSCPNLKYLVMENTQFYLPEGSEECSIPGKMPLASSIFHFPKLEHLSIRSMTIDDKLTASLQYCPLLRHLNILWCPTDDFIPSFISILTDDKTLPSLENLHIRRLKGDKISLHKVFGRICVGLRPGLVVSIDDFTFGGAS